MKLNVDGKESYKTIKISSVYSHLNIRIFLNQMTQTDVLNVNMKLVL